MENTPHKGIFKLCVFVMAFGDLTFMEGVSITAATLYKGATLCFQIWESLQNRALIISW